MGGLIIILGFKIAKRRKKELLSPLPGIKLGLCVHVCEEEERWFPGEGLRCSGGPMRTRAPVPERQRGLLGLSVTCSLMLHSTNHGQEVHGQEGELHLAGLS